MHLHLGRGSQIRGHQALRSRLSHRRLAGTDFATLLPSVRGGEPRWWAATFPCFICGFANQPGRPLPDAKVAGGRNAFELLNSPDDFASVRKVRRK